MIVYKVTLSLNGEKFSPSVFLNIEKFDFLIFDRNEPDELIWENSNETYEFGSISIINKTTICLKNEFDSYEKWYRDFFKKNKRLLIHLGLSKVIYNIDIFYSDFCSFELSPSENYNCYQSFDFSIPINVYKLPEDEIISLLLENNYTKEFIEEYEW